MEIHQQALNTITTKKSMTPYQRIFVIYLLDFYYKDLRFNWINRKIGETIFGMPNDKQISTKVSRILHDMVSKDIIQISYSHYINSNGIEEKGSRIEISFSNNVKNELEK